MRHHQQKRAAFVGRNPSSSFFRRASPEGATGLPDTLHDGLEQHFGADFSQVRIHQNSSRADELNARAFTQGHDIHFAPGEYQPNTPNGRHLMAHEFAHVQQQRAGRVRGDRQLKGANLNTSKSLEQEADHQADRFVKSAGQTTASPMTSNTTATPAAAPIQRKLVVKGSTAAKRKAFFNKIKAASAIPLAMSKTGVIDQEFVGPYAPKDIFTQVIQDAIFNAQTVNLSLVGQDDQIFVDSFATGEVDVDDMMALTTDLFRSSLAHFVKERFQIKDYEKNKGKATFGPAHKDGLKVEEKYFREKYPKKTIKFVKEGIVPKSKKVDKSGNGTVKYFYDFTDIQQIYTQTVRGGTIIEDIIKSEVKIIR